MYAIIDIETTGGGNGGHRITDIAILIHDGFRIVSEFQSLVNPESHIPNWIIRLTGITNAMVSNAPKFHEIAEKVYTMTKDKVFIAHSVNFDYGVIKAEFDRLGVSFRRQKLCSVRTARKWLPGHRSYSLGKICSDLKISIEGRHRAYGDAKATVELMEIIFSKARESGIHDFTNLSSFTRELFPKHLTQIINGLPNLPGVFYLHDEHGTVIYFSATENIQSGALRFLSENSKTKETINLGTVQVTYETTGSELIADMLEISEMSRWPQINYKPKIRTKQGAIHCYMNQRGILELKVGPAKMMGNSMALFQSIEAANMRLRSIFRKYNLCPKFCTQDDSISECHFCLKRNCIEEALDEVEIAKYNKQVTCAMTSMTLEGANFYIILPGRKDDEKGVVKIENGRYVGHGFVDVELLSGSVGEIGDSINPGFSNNQITMTIREYLDENPNVRKIALPDK